MLEPDKIAATAARAAYLLDHAEDVDGEDRDAMLAPFRVALGEIAAAAEDPERVAEAALCAHKVADLLSAREQTSRRWARRAQAQAQRYSAAAGIAREVLADILRSVEGHVVDTPEGNLFMRPTGRPKITAEGDASALPFDLFRPQPAKLDRKAATAYLVELAERGEDLPEGWALDLDPAHPMMGA